MGLLLSGIGSVRQGNFTPDFEIQVLCDIFLIAKCNHMALFVLAVNKGLCATFRTIFENMGYDPLVVGYTRMHSVPQNLRKVVEAGRPFTDGYSGRGKKSSESGWHKSRSEQKAEGMQYEIAHLRQHVEFLKKLQMRAMGKSGAGNDHDTKPEI